MTTWKELESIMLSEIYQTKQKQILCNLTYMKKLKNGNNLSKQIGSSQRQRLEAGEMRKIVGRHKLPICKQVVIERPSNWGSGLPCWLICMKPPANSEYSINPLSGRSPGGGNGNPLWYSCLGNAMDSGAWWAVLHGVSKVRHNLVTTQQQLG